MEGGSAVDERRRFERRHWSGLPRTAHEPEVLVELVELHCRVLMRMPVLMPFVIAAVALDSLDYLSGRLFAAWAVGVLAVELVRAMVARRILAGRIGADRRGAHRLLIGLAACAGLAVGSSAVLFFPRIPTENQALLALIYFAMTAGGVAVSASSQAILATYSFTMIAPAAVGWSLAHPHQALITSSLALIYCGFLVMLAGDGERLLVRSILIRRERDRMVQDLEQKNADVQRAVAAAEQSAMARARVLAAASHDLRQPLHALSIYSAILSSRPDPATLAEVSHSIDQLVRALGNLLNGLLDLSRLSSGHYVPDRQVFALDKVAADVVAEMRPPIEGKGLALAARLETIVIESDPTAIGRVLRNLLDNALKYTESGSIAVTLERREQCAVLAVADTGKGIPPAEQARIFEEFYQLDNEARDRAKGVGLGLAIVQRLCELLDGRIGVRSEPGQGATFEVELPLPLQVAGREEVPVAAMAGAALAGCRVYVVDDEPEIRRSMSVLLGLWGMAVETAATPAELDRLFDTGGVPDLLLIDLRLGEGEHGAQTARRLLERHGAFGVLIITGETSSVALQEANREGFPLLQKPILPESLSQAARAAIGRTQRGDCSRLRTVK